MLHRAFGLAIALLALWPCCARRAEARPADRPLVILTETGHADAEDAAFLRSLRAHAAELGMLIGTRDVPSLLSVREALVLEAQKASKPFLVAWILRDGPVRKLHLFDPWNNQLRTRDVESGNSPAANAETLALILRAELIAYLAELPPEPPPAPPPAPVPPQPVEPSLSADAAFAIGTFLRGWDPWMGARIAATYHPGRLRIGAGYTVLAEHAVQDPDATFVLQRHPVDVFVGVASRDSRRVRFAVDVSLSLDAIHQHTTLATPPLSPSADESRRLFSVAAKGRGELRVFSWLDLFVAAGVEVPLNPFDFRTTRGGTAATVARMAPVRGLAEAGLCFLLL